MGSKKKSGKQRRSWQAQIARPLEASTIMKKYVEYTFRDGTFKTNIVNAEALLVASHWGLNHETIYSVDAELLTELLRSGLPTEPMPSDIFHRLPHTSPMFVLDKPVTVKYDEQTYSFGHFVAVFMSDSLKPVAADEADCLRFLWIGINHESPYFDVNIVTQTVDLDTTTVDLPDILQHSRLCEPETGSDEDKEQWESAHLKSQWADTVESLFPIAVMTTLYACSEQPDLLDMEPPPVVSTKATLKGSTLNVKRMGMRVGSALRQHRRPSGIRSDTSGRHVAPHVRRAHWHRFWTGPRDGERRLVLRWLPPIPVSLDNGPIQSTVHPMKASALWDS